jgi:hypothetical protein
MKQNIAVRVTTAIVIVVLSVGTWFTSGEFNLGWLRLFSVAATTAALTLTLWDLWLWRVALVQRIPRVPRQVRGTWQGTLTSLWIDPATGSSPPVKTVYLVVRQTASLVTIKLFTDESQSKSTLASMSSDDTGWTLSYLYLNRPEINVEPRSRMHHGSAVLDVSGRPVIRLYGRYWTDRDSKGQLDFTRHDRKLADDFHEASSYFS